MCRRDQREEMVFMRVEGREGVRGMEGGRFKPTGGVEGYREGSCYVA